MKKLCPCPEVIRKITIEALGITVCKQHYYEWLKTEGRQSEIPLKQFSERMPREPFDVPAWRDKSMYYNRQLMKLVPSK